MPVEREDDALRRTVVPPAAGRSLWLSAAWTGVGAAVVCAVIAIIGVAICWLPASGAGGHSISAVRAGLLTFLAALHGGLTVDGTPTAFVPLGMTIAVGLTAWRAGTGLADAALALEEQDRGRLLRAGLVQVASFAIACLVMIPFSTLGTSHASAFGVGLAAIVLFAATGGVAFVRSSDLAGWWSERMPATLTAVPRVAAAAVAVYVGMGALLAVGSVVVHHGQVETLSRQVGGGWSGVPVLLLGVLAAPNAAIAGSAYLAGPGFAVGSGSTVSAFSATHGTVPAFPILGALPSGHGASAVVWWLMVATPLLAGFLVSRLATRASGRRARLASAAAGCAGAGVLMAVLTWQGGGGIGDGRLATVGAAPWLVGFLVAGEVAVVAGVGLVGAGAWRWLDSGEAPGLAALLTAHDDEDAPVVAARAPAPRENPLRVVAEQPADPERPNKLAG